MKSGKFTKVAGTAVSVILSAGLLLTGCGSSASSAARSEASSSAEAEYVSASSSGTSAVAAVTGEKSSHPEDGTDPIEIAYVLYSWSDDQGVYLEDYLNYLTDNFNVDIECVSYESTEDLVDQVESLCSKGVDGIIVASDDAFQSWAQICEDNGVWCSISLGRLSDEDDREFAAGLDYYLGSCGNYDYSFLGEEYANFIIDQGYESVLIAAPSEGLQDQADQMVAATVSTLENSDVEFEVVRSTWGDMFGSIAASLASTEFDAIYCPLSLMSFGVPQIYSNDLVGQTVVMGHGLDESMSDCIEAGIVTMFSDNLTTSAGYNVALIINAVEGNMYPDFPTGEAVNVVSPTFIIQGGDDFAVYTEYVRNYDDPVYYISAAAVENMILSYNADATFEETRDYLEGLNIDNLAENVIE